jgi:hypothetical protein
MIPVTGSLTSGASVAGGAAPSSGDSVSGVSIAGGAPSDGSMSGAQLIPDTPVMIRSTMIARMDSPFLISISLLF